MTDFKAVQQQFASWLRQPDQQPLPADIEPRRMAVYRRLVRNAIYGFLSSGFPVLKKRLSSQQWQHLVDEFIAKHTAQSPYFSDMGREFVDFLAVYFANTSLTNSEFPQFTYELACYERMEVDAQFATIDDSHQHVATDEAADLLYNCSWWLNSSVQLAQFAQPVAWLDGALDSQPPPSDDSGYLLMVYRPPYDRVQFMHLQPLTAVLLSSLQQQQPQSVQALQQQLSGLLPQLDSTTVEQGVEQLCLDFVQRGVLLRAL